MHCGALAYAADCSGALKIYAESRTKPIVSWAFLTLDLTVDGLLTLGA
jgi:hypothetical protein